MKKVVIEIILITIVIFSILLIPNISIFCNPYSGSIADKFLNLP